MDNWKRNFLSMYFVVFALPALAQTTPAPSPPTAPFEPPYPSDVMPPTAISQHICMAGYPPFARRDHIEGAAVVSFVVTVRGAVRDAKIVQSTGDADLDNASVACVMPWLFDPAMQNGKPVEVVEKIRQVWQLDK